MVNMKDGNYLKEQRMKFLADKILILLLLMTSTTGFSQKKESKRLNIIKDLLHLIYEKENLTEEHNMQCNFHTVLKQINDKSFFAYISINHLLPKEKGYNQVIINGLNSYNLFFNKNQKIKLGSAFFIPDSKSWEFYIHVKGNDFIYKKMTPYIKNNTIENSNELNFFEDD